MIFAHLISPIELFNGARCVVAPTGWTDAEDFSIGGTFGSYHPFPSIVLEGTGGRVSFGVCCRKSVTVALDVTLNSGAPITAHYTLYLKDATGTNVVWTSSSPAIADSGVINVLVPLDIDACGAHIWLQSPARTSSGSGSIITINVLP